MIPKRAAQFMLEICHFPLPSFFDIVHFYWRIKIYFVYITIYCIYNILYAKFHFNLTKQSYLNALKLCSLGTTLCRCEIKL